MEQLNLPIDRTKSCFYEIKFELLFLADDFFPSWLFPSKTNHTNDGIIPKKWSINALAVSESFKFVSLSLIMSLALGLQLRAFSKACNFSIVRLLVWSGFRFLFLFASVTLTWIFCISQNRFLYFAASGNSKGRHFVWELGPEFIHLSNNRPITRVNFELKIAILPNWWHQSK